MQVTPQIVAARSSGRADHLNTKTATQGGADSAPLLFDRLRGTILHTPEGR